MKYIKLFENFKGYQDIFVEKLTKLFPHGVKLYHRTSKENLESIMINGLSPEYGTRIYGIHTVLGDSGIDRIGGSDIILLEITILPEDYYRLYPETNTYWDDSMEILDDGDQEINELFKIYMKIHPDLIGGDIVIDEVIDPKYIKVV